MKKNKKFHLSIKIALYFLACFVIIMMIATLIGSFVLRGIYGQLSQEKLMTMFYIGITSLGIITMITFILCMHLLVVKRIAKLNHALDEVVKGNYDINVPVKGNDELTMLSKSFNVMTSELKANELLSKDFTTYISHEYKTPLSIIRGYAEILENSTSNDIDKESCHIMIAEVDRLSELSKSMLELVKLDSVTIIKKNDEFSPATQIRKMLQMTHLLWDSKHITLNLNLDEFNIKSNQKMLYLVWQNLINNAIKFSKCDGHIDILLKKKTHSFLFEITDNGVGINDNDKQKVFTHFFVGHKINNGEGSGLGLALTKKITEKLNGHISFNSKIDVGTTFKLELPL